MTAIFSRVRLNARQLAAMVGFVILASLAQMVAPALVSRMIDGVAGNDQKTIIVLAIAMIVLSLAACLTNVVATNLAAALTTRFSADLRRELFNKVQSFSATEIDRFGTASLISRNTSDETMIQTFLTMLFRIGVLTPMMAAIGLVLAIAFTGRLAVVLVIAVPVLIVVVGLILFNASRYSVKLRSMIDGINRLFLETLEGVRVIRAFNRQEHGGVPQCDLRLSGGRRAGHQIGQLCIKARRDNCDHRQDRLRQVEHRKADPPALRHSFRGRARGRRQR